MSFILTARLQASGRVQAIGGFSFCLNNKNAKSCNSKNNNNNFHNNNNKIFDKKIIEIILITLVLINIIANNMSVSNAVDDIFVNSDFLITVFISCS